jgi:anti-sigma B factor antagonist
MENIRIESNLRFVQNIPVLDIVGEIDIYTTPQFKEAVTAAIEQGGPAIVINMKKVSYMDSSGFGTLLSATKKLRPMNGSLFVCNCNEAITRMLQITRLDSIFGVCASEEEAIAGAATSLATHAGLSVDVAEPHAVAAA